MNNRLIEIRNHCSGLIHDYINSEQSPEVIRDVLIYSLGDTGKLLRPSIVEMVQIALDIKSIALDKFKLALEMTHVASLIHDDLPSLDNDDLRRGKPSLHKKYNEGLAILSGDLIYAMALTLLNDPLIPVRDSQLLTRSLLNAQVLLSEGQILEFNIKTKADKAFYQLLASNNQSELIKTIENISLKKTGALFWAAAEAPLVISNQDPSLIVKLENVFKCFSILFQLKDDFLDSKHDSELNEEINHITILGLEKSKHYYDNLFQSTLAEIDSLGDKFQLLKQFFVESLSL